MPTGPSPQPSWQTQAGGEAFGEQPQWGSPQPHPHCTAAASLPRQSQLCQVPHAGKSGAPWQKSLWNALRGLTVSLCMVSQYLPSAWAWVGMPCCLLPRFPQCQGLIWRAREFSGHRVMGVSSEGLFLGMVALVGFCWQAKGVCQGPA